MTYPARLSRAERRDQLLNAASDLLQERGATTITMEGLALHAGVSKALPYVHFDNAEAVVVGLYRREIARINERVTHAMAAEHDPESRLAAGVRGYFEIVEEQGSILSILAAPGSPVPHLADGGARIGNRFVAQILEREFSIKPHRALLGAALILGVLNGAVDAWANKETNRAQAEAASVTVILQIARSQAGR